jgi:hypothetical protein
MAFEPEFPPKGISFANPPKDHEIIPLSADELKTHDFSWVLSSSEQANAVNDLLKISYNTTPTVYA